MRTLWFSNNIVFKYNRFKINSNNKILILIFEFVSKVFQNVKQFKMYYRKIKKVNTLPQKKKFFVIVK